MADHTLANTLSSHRWADDLHRVASDGEHDRRFETESEKLARHKHSEKLGTQGHASHETDRPRDGNQAAETNKTIDGTATMKPAATSSTAVMLTSVKSLASTSPSVQTLTSTYDPNNIGAYDQFGTYYSGSANYATTESGGIDPAQIAYATFDAAMIESEVKTLQAAGDNVSVTLGYTFGNPEPQNDNAGMMYEGFFTSIGFQTSFEGDTTNHTGPGNGSDAYVYDDALGQGEQILLQQPSINEGGSTNVVSTDISAQIEQAAAAARDLVLTLRAGNGEISILDPTVTISYTLPAAAAPTVSGTVADQPDPAGGSIMPFSTVQITDPGSPSGDGDVITITILDSSGDGTDALGTLTETNGATLTHFAGGNYTLDPSGAASTATLQADLEALKFTAAGNAAGSTATFEIDVQSVSKVTTDNQGTSVFITAPCFAAGTLIRTLRGEIAVEALVVGDIAVTRYHSRDRTRPIVWIGQRHVDISRHPEPHLVRPIRFAPGSLGDGLPARALLLSPDHALLLEGHLIAARQLVNHGSIQILDVPSVRYFHVELDQHAILLAEGCEVESYLDTGNRRQFENGNPTVVLHPDFSRIDHPDACLPLTTDAEFIEPIWQHLARRSRMLGWNVNELVVTSDAQLTVQAPEGQMLVPQAGAGGRYQLWLGAGMNQSTTIRLHSRATAPADIRPWLDDRRQLGVCVSALRVWTQDTGLTPLSLQLDTAIDGWWSHEKSEGAEWRWTNGNAAITVPPRCTLLEIELHATGQYLAELSEAA